MGTHWLFYIKQKESRMKKHWVSVFVLFSVVLALAACPTSGGGGSNPNNSLDGDGSLQVKIILFDDDGETTPHRSTVDVPANGSVDLSIEYNKGSGWSAGESISLTYKVYFKDELLESIYGLTFKRQGVSGPGRVVANNDKLKVVVTNASGATAEAETTFVVN
jgi:hypothetical protein